MDTIARSLVFTFSLGLLPALGSAQNFSVPPQVREQWSARLTLGMDGVARRPVASLLSDHYFQDGQVSALGLPRSGFRATSGLMLGAGSAALGAASAPGGLYAASLSMRDAIAGSPGTAGSEAFAVPWITQPYAGLGYSHQADDGAWGLSADVGVVAVAPTDWSLGRALLGPNRLDEAVRTLRLRPVLQLGMRYRF